ncbi:hypothetical protein YC2023_102961 [Brassica napus]|uniref:Knottin scorpion toxin-like domain-containing protein n=1 Tax=Brassica oleracea TaxID=3712 RepID=A0A3P6GMY1_BRAOL|nr:unnamed protein product [Brassica oleracea]
MDISTYTSSTLLKVPSHLLRMAMKETQGQENCHEYYTETGICEHNQCAAQCASKRNGTGRCVIGTKNCICSYNCKF